MLEKNVGQIDRIAKIIIGLLFILLTLTNHIGVWGWIGVFPLATGLVGNCLFYSLLGINTNKPD